MKIKLFDEIYWDTESTKQDDAALQWINENVISKLGADGTNSDFITPEKDVYGRPYRWAYQGDGFTVEVIRDYIAPKKWAKKGDIINVIAV